MKKVYIYYGFKRKEHRKNLNIASSSGEVIKELLREISFSLMQLFTDESLQLCLQ